MSGEIFQMIFGTGGPRDIVTPYKASQMGQQTAATAEPTEQARKSKRMAASILTRQWNTPRLGSPGLLG